MAEINDLSTTDASNTARFPENQLPSTVNDGARALEGLVARWHKDTNGSVTSSGSSNAYVIAANQTLSAYYNGLDITFQANHTNTGASTVNVDSVGAVAIEKDGSVALTGGEILSGNKYRIVHDGTNFILTNPSPIAASATVSGIVELATNAEANTGTDTARAVTPANLGQIISGATAETAPATGDSVFLYDASAAANRKMTLENVLNVVNGLTEDTSPANSSDFLLSYDTSASGVKKVKPSNLFTAAAASQAQMESASATDVYATPGRTQYHPGVAKAWVVFTSGATPSISASHNVSGVVRNGTGDYTISFTTAFSSATYVCVALIYDTVVRSLLVQPYAQATGSASVAVFNTSTGALSSTFTNCQITFFGDQ
jgi:hypothetical protein